MHAPHGRAATCCLNLLVLRPHPGDPHVLVPVAVYLAGRTYTVPLTARRDGGLELAGAIVGYSGTQPYRFEAAMQRDHPAGCCLVPIRRCWKDPELPD